MREMRNLIQRFPSHCYRVIDFQGHLIKIDEKKVLIIEMDREGQG